MPYLLLDEGRVVDDLPETARLCRKFMDMAGGREFYMIWHGLALRSVSIYPLLSTGRVRDGRIMRIEVSDAAEVPAICQEWKIPREWVVANYGS